MCEVLVTADYEFPVGETDFDAMTFAQVLGIGVRKLASQVTFPPEIVPPFPQHSAEPSSHLRISTDFFSVLTLLPYTGLNKEAANIIVAHLENKLEADLREMYPPYSKLRKRDLKIKPNTTSDLPQDNK